MPSRAKPASAPTPRWSTTCRSSIASERVRLRTRSPIRSRASTPARFRCARSGLVDGSAVGPRFEDESDRREEVELERASGRIPARGDDLAMIDVDRGPCWQLELEDLDVIALAFPVLDLVVHFSELID